MKNKLSLFSLIVIIICFIGYRSIHFQNNRQNGYTATTWDAFGYYMYLPSAFIYHDFKKLEWVAPMDKKYQLTGGTFYQAIAVDSGSYTNKYLCGVAIIEMPYFLIGHTVAYFSEAVQDGFSWPYQYAICFGAIFWAMIGFIFIRKSLLHFFDDRTTALSLLLIGLCSNLIQYVSVDAAMSHVYIFTLYAIVIQLSLLWHKQAKLIYALLIGFICGLAVISRPTEIIICLIPLLWGMQDKAHRTQKWALVKQHRQQVWATIIAGIIGMLPQLLYWQYTTGSPIFDVGSKWFFLNPWFRVLVGPEKGWFVYTPVALLLFIGLWKMNNYPFQKAVLYFCLLNIWIIISWSDWRYGSSYSARALVQSYPVFALALAALIKSILKHKRGYWIYPTAILLIFLNFYQLELYNGGQGESFSPILKLFGIS